MRVGHYSIIRAKPMDLLSKLEFGVRGEYWAPMYSTPTLHSGDGGMMELSLSKVWRGNV